MHIRASVLVLAAAASLAQAQPATFTSFPSPSLCTDVSGDGEYVVGWRSGTGAFRWSAAGGFENLPGLTHVGSWPRISTDGGTIAWDGQGRLYRWQQATGTVQLASVNWHVQGLSGDGSTIVGATSQQPQAFRWRQDTGVTQLLPPAGYPTANAAAYAVSYDGSRAAGTYFGTGPSGFAAPASRWDGDGTTALGTNIGIFPEGVATTMTPDGNTIFGYSQGLGGFDTFRWTSGTGLVNLGVVGAGVFSMPMPLDVTPNGQILVGQTLGNAFLWRLGVGPRDLKQVLEEDFGLNLAGYNLIAARGISADGRTVVGNGMDLSTGVGMGWVVSLPWSIPGPGAGSVLVLAGLAAARRHRIARGV